MLILPTSQPRAAAPAPPCSWIVQKQRLLCQKTSTGQSLQSREGRAGHSQRLEEQPRAVSVPTTSLLFPTAPRASGWGGTEGTSQSLFSAPNASNSHNFSHFPAESLWLVLSLMPQQVRCCSLSTLGLLRPNPRGVTSAASGLVRPRINSVPPSLPRFRCSVPATAPTRATSHPWNLQFHSQTWFLQVFDDLPPVQRSPRSWGVQRHKIWGKPSLSSLYKVSCMSQQGKTLTKTQ